MQIFSKSVGGGETLFYNFVKGMKEKGHRVSVICHELKDGDSQGLESDMSDLEKEGIKIYKIKPAIEARGGILLTYGQQLGYIINALKKGFEILRGSQIDIIHANTYTPVIPAFLLGKIFKIPVVSTVHHVTLGQWKLWASQQKVSRSTSFIGPIYEKVTLKLPVQAVHAVSYATKADLMKVNPGANVTVVYNGIDLRDYKGYDTKFEYNYKNFILYIGRLVVTKNLEVVIRAFERIIPTLPDAKLIIVGDGPMRSPWENLVTNAGLSKNISFMGYVSTPSKQELLRSCTALVLPSRLEGFGRVIIEAFGMSKPVLVSDMKAEAEIVQNGVDGFLISPDKLEDWADKMKYLLSNREHCISMGRNGRIKVEKKFNINLISHGIEELYKDVVFSKKAVHV